MQKHVSAHVYRFSTCGECGKQQAALYEIANGRWQVQALDPAHDKCRRAQADRIRAGAFIHERAKSIANVS